MADDNKTTDPNNPENRIGLERQAADREHEAQIASQSQPAARKAVGSRQPKKQVEVQSTGHSWDGITEYDNPMPRWWLWTFYATIVWGVLYTIAYPAWPWIDGATRGVLGYNSRDEVAAEIQRFNDMNAPIEAQLTEVALDQIPANAELNSYAQNAGGAVFATWCAQCHGLGADGNRGFPNLRDDDWLWGGALDDIYTTVQHGIRNTEDPDARYSEMPKYGVDGILDRTQINQVANYVLSLSGKAENQQAAAAGAEIYADNCAACHAEDGTGDRAQGAPNLTDAIWLYAPNNQPNVANVSQIISDGPFGVMPAWGGRLTEAQIRSVSVYVHGLGGGE